MRCNSCLGPVLSKTNLCVNCTAQRVESVQTRQSSWRCPQCGRLSSSASNRCSRCDWRNPFPIGDSERTRPSAKTVAIIPKSRTSYILLGLFFGSLGIHNFYASRTEIGLMQLVITLFSLCFIFLIVPFFFLLGIWVWVFIDLVSVDRDGYGRRMR